MKTAGLLREKITTIVILLSACFFLVQNTGCGLDSFYVLDAPLSDGHTAYYTADDYAQKYFSLMTYETGTNADYLTSSSELSFKGTEIYYKIYNNLSTMLSNQSTVSSLNTASNYSAAAERLIETQGYKQLKLSNGAITPLIKATGKNRYVYIRLTDYGGSEAYQQGICVASSIMNSYDSSNALTYNGVAVFPRRYINSSYTFNFGGDNSDTDKVPTKDDDDVTWSTTTTETGKWYVDMYAISIGKDTTFSNSYSLVLHLGSMTIVQGEKN